MFQVERPEKSYITSHWDAWHAYHSNLVTAQLDNETDGRESASEILHAAKLPDGKPRGQFRLNDTEAITYVHAPLKYSSKTISIDATVKSKQWFTGGILQIFGVWPKV